MQTKQLSDFVLGIRYGDLSEQAVETAKMCVLDLVGVALAGSARKEAQIWKQYFLTEPQPGQATLWDRTLGRWGYRQAAGINAAFGHMLDMDDVHNSSITHLGVVTIPASLAVGQKLGSTGKEVLAAIVGGYEIGARVGEGINPGSYRFWHTTGVVGSFSSAVATGKLLNLDRDQMLHCIGSAGTQSAGLWEFLEDGAMSKPLHTANATLAGIRAAELALYGLTGASKILEGDRALMKALTPDCDLDAITRDLEKREYKILSNSFKPYACCRHTHSANYCVEKILQMHTIDPDKIVSILDRTYQVAKDSTDKPQPNTPYAYKFSLQYCIAASIIYKTLLDNVFSEERINNPKVRSLMEKVEVVVDDQLEKEFQADPNQWTHILEFTMEDGSVIRERVDYPLGDFKNPFGWKEADSKFLGLTQGILSEEQALAFIRNVKQMEDMEDINQLFAL